MNGINPVWDMNSGRPPAFTLPIKVIHPFLGLPKARHRQVEFQPELTNRTTTGIRWV
jgi:hypothetical protein